MSTRSAIIEKVGTAYRGIYCHFDGYVEGVGAKLLASYSDQVKVRALVDLGDISVLGEEVAPADGVTHSFDKKAPGVTVAYGRDRGERGVEPKVGATAQEVADQIGHNGYVYVFEGGAWTVNGQPLADAIRAAAEVA